MSMRYLMPKNFAECFDEDGELHTQSFLSYLSHKRARDSEMLSIGTEFSQDTSSAGPKTKSKRLRKGIFDEVSKKWIELDPMDTFWYKETF